MLLNLTGYQASETVHTGTRTLVYRARRLRDDRPVIIKVLRNPQPPLDHLVQFRNQYAITKNLDAPLILKPLALERHENSYALVMPDQGAVSLQDYWQERMGQIDAFLAIAIQLAQALHSLSQQRIIHKDIKPANILIQPETGHIQLADFSISTLLPKETQTLQPPKRLEGTLAYISPEQTGRMNRGIDYRSDFYSLGVTFYELLTGQLPFASQDHLELVHSHIAKTPSWDIFNTQLAIPDVLVLIIQKLMAKNAEDRYQSALGLKYDLEQCQQQWQDHKRIESFNLGQRDQSDRFNIPEKLYGRKKEVQTLLDAFERVAAGKREMMLVAGFSGIGKTAVVNEVHKPIVRHSGYFIKGKFDQFNRNIPFSAFVQAFRDLMEQLLGESDAELACWRDKILTALGENGQVLIDVIPELERIIGTQPPVPELSGSAAQNRFNLLFEKFIAIFTTPEHPLTLFVDDLQWVDAASLNLMQVLMEDTQTGYLLLLGVYRDNEVAPTHPLILSLTELEKQQVTISTITLSPLSIGNINQFVSETLGCTLEAAINLTRLVYQNTQGNPFFMTRFLRGLYEDRFVQFNPSQGIWEWDLAAVREASLTDDVVAFMTGRLQKLPTATQDVLKLAACLGNQFNLEILAVICEATADEVAINIWTALQEELVLPISETYKIFQGEIESSPTEAVTVNYRFLHDRVQQAAYSLIPDQKKAKTHNHIGQLLLGHLSAEEQQQSIFDIVNHLNLGRSLIEEEAEQKKLAQLNLAAGQRSMESTAYAATIDYIKTGIELLGASAWLDYYELMVELYYNLCAAQLSNVQYEELSETISIAFQQISSPIERSKFYIFQINQYILQGRYIEAISSGLMGLRELGIDIDTQRDDIAELANQEFNAVDCELKDRSVASLLNLPTKIDPNIEAAIQLMAIVETPSYIIGNINLYILTSLKAVNLSIKHGNIPESIKPYSNYGILLCVLKERYVRGAEFGELALELSYKLNSRSQRSKVGLNFANWIQVWSKPITGAAALHYQSFLDGFESGETLFAAYNLYGNIFSRFFEGDSLSNMLASIHEYSLYAQKFKDDLLSITLAGSEIFIKLLSKEQFEQQNQDKSLSRAEQIIQNGEVSQSWLGVCLYYVLRMHSACVMDRFQEGFDYLQKAQPVLSAIAGSTTSSCYYYYGSLILLNLVLEFSPEEQNTAWEQINVNQAQVKKWSESCPENFLHKYHLVEAEKHRVLDHKLEAVELYDQAIAGAKANGFIQEEALANELAAKFYLDWQREKVARTYLTDAYYCYSYWGATAKVQQLETAYPQLLRSTTVRTTTDNTLSPRDSTHSTSSHSGSNLDVAALMKASQSLASELVLSQLLTQLINVLLESTGAQAGFLLLETAGELRIEAGVAAHGEIEVLQSLPLDFTEPNRNVSLICPAIVNYVAHTQETVVLNDACQEGQFTNQADLQTRQVKSVLCVPLLNQGQLKGVVYLENNLATAAFSRDRCEVVQLLSSQATISLENARFYQTLEGKVAQRTEQLAAANSEITQLNQRLKAENLRMGAELDVAQRVQEMMLPRSTELTAIPDLDIAGAMQPADEVGGDYYDVLVEGDRVTLAIGDVTGHGLESGLVMLMTQTTVRTLTKLRETDPVRFLNTVNATLYENVQRMGVDRNLTLAILNYAQGQLRITGQHEEVLLVRADGSLQRLDTLDLGITVALLDDIQDFITQTTVEIGPGDGVVLYTDGIPEAQNAAGEFYGLERLCRVLQSHWQADAQAVLNAVLVNLQSFIGDCKVMDDITLLVFKRRSQNE
ncbi:MAG: AAA family ATPase [Cyanobacteria bacterium P01_G01_bin.54]